MNEELEFKKYLLPSYLLVVLMLQVNLEIFAIIAVVLPILIIVFGIYKQSKPLGILGMFLFYTISFSTVTVSHAGEPVFLALEIVFLLLPSLWLLNQILKTNLDTEDYGDNLGVNKKPLFLSISTFFIITFVFYGIIEFGWEGYLLSSESISGQILLLFGLSFLGVLLFLSFNRVENIKR